MKILARVAWVIVSAALCIAMAGCDKSSSKSEAAESSSVKEPDSSASPSTVSIKKYSFPSFINAQEKPDMLSREVYRSFDKEKAATAVTVQPFEDKYCTGKIGDKLYTYTSGEYVGLLNADGRELIKADKYYRITAVSGNLLMCSADKDHKESVEYYAVYENASVARYDFKGFSAENIRVSEYDDVDAATGETSKKYFITLYTGSNVEYPKESYMWDYAEKCDAKTINTSKSYRAYYKVTRGGASYYICFDDYYNYVIYEASYAKIRLKIGNVSGECYVQSFDDYTELTRMVKSFGKAKAASTPDENETLDYVQITFGINSADQYVMTMSSDGWCLTDNVTHNNQPDNKFFACYDKDSFVSLVLWVDQVISKEYAAKN